MKLLLDMNLAPLWCDALRRHGLEAVHWSEVGDPRAPDAVVMEWARSNGCVVVTHDLDFGALLAATRASGPSVVQIRAQDILPAALEDLLVNVLRQHASALEAGALVVADPMRSRVRLLPLHSSN
jgi:predicted nuclease of predicted toxin-antitoxin system